MTVAESSPRGEYAISDLAPMAKGMFVAPDGYQFVARDFSGIEAVLVGWFAGSQRYTRLAKLGVHDYFLAHGILKPERLIAEADLPNLAWTDADLRTCFAGLKKNFKAKRDVAKRCVHLSNYLGTPGKMNEEYPETFPTKRSAAIIQGAYFDLFPEVSEWHWRECKRVDKDQYVRMPSGFIHRFYRVLAWKKFDGEWRAEFGDDAKRLIATQPQHTAAWIGKLVLKRLYHNHTDLANRIQKVNFSRGLAKAPTWTPRMLGATNYAAPVAHPWMRLFIHDEVLGECPNEFVEEIDALLQFEMEQPIPGLPLDPTWGMGEFLTIGSEGKAGPSWGSMK